MGLVSNYDTPDQPEIVVLHDGSVQEVKAYVYDGRGLKGVVTREGRWIDQALIHDAEPQFPDTTCNGYPAL